MHGNYESINGNKQEAKAEMTICSAASHVCIYVHHSTAAPDLHKHPPVKLAYRIEQPLSSLLHLGKCGEDLPHNSRTAIQGT